MLQEPVAIQITRGTLDAIAARHPRWKTSEAVWEEFRKWTGGRGKEVGLSYEDRPPYFHDLLDLYDFGHESCPAEPLDEFLRRSGGGFAGILLRERLPDLLAACMIPGYRLPESIGNLFVRFMGQYSGYLYRYASDPGPNRLVFTLSYADPPAIQKHLRTFQRDPREAFRRSFVAIAGTVETCLEYLVDPWDPKALRHDAAEGSIRIEFDSRMKFNHAKLLETLAHYTRELERRHAEQLFDRDLEHDLILESRFMREKWEKIKRASVTDEIILLRGEPGTGKTYLAERIHEMSVRKGKRFVEVGLTADTGSDNFVQSHLFGHVKGAFTGAHEDKDGLFALAHKGTIFLDEIGDTSPEVQAKLLRVIEKKTFKRLGSTQDVTVDVRIIAATNKDLESMVRSGTFRQDLYDRLNVIQFDLPPLRDRSEEIPLLSEHFMKRVGLQVKKPPKPLAPPVLGLMRTYPWPGNIRELIHALKYALLFSLGEKIELHDLPDRMRAAARGPIARSAPAEPAPAAPADEVIHAGRLSELLSRRNEMPLVKSDTSNCPWHIDYAKKVYLRALIQACHGNLREMTAYWDCDSEHTLRSLIKRFGLWDDVEKARNS
ncbi:MAG TPA: sigma 54-interacting transcriptional regulator [Planctomycetota bacterium]|nr:sigma 54-interacting transcriptional regulator [Planctomycetota bacterium]